MARSQLNQCDWAVHVQHQVDGYTSPSERIAALAGIHRYETPDWTVSVAVITRYWVALCSFDPGCGVCTALPGSSEFETRQEDEDKPKPAVLLM